MTVYLNIGSNTGDRHALIGQAVACIREMYPAARVRLSSLYESEPWGYDSPNMFLNLGVAVDLDGDVDPLETLDAMQGIERRVCPGPHRDAAGAYRDRGIDIDIIAIDTLRLDHARLVLPHPRARLRDFVMVPLRELAPHRVVEFISECARGR